MKRKPAPKLVSTRIPTRAEVALALAAAGLITGNTAFASAPSPADGAAPSGTTAPAAPPSSGDDWFPKDAPAKPPEQAPDFAAAPSEAAEEDESWFPKEGSVEPRPGEGLLILEGLRPDYAVLLNGKPAKSESLEKGMSLRPKRYKLEVVTFSSNHEVTVFRGDAVIEEGKTIRIQLPSVPITEREDVTGGVPPRDEFTVHGGCCGTTKSSARSLAGGSPALTALGMLGTALLSRRRKRRK